MASWRAPAGLTTSTRVVSGGGSSLQNDTIFDTLLEGFGLNVDTLGELAVGLLTDDRVKIPTLSPDGIPTFPSTCILARFIDIGRKVAGKKDANASSTLTASLAKLSMSAMKMQSYRRKLTTELSVPRSSAILFALTSAMPDISTVSSMDIENTTSLVTKLPDTIQEIIARVVDE